ncbi:metalloregulator ArsR/SmtB family transcription factor [Erysipelothrix urinaevulpis]|uniref:ArsR/SmtB family transcription factor n=1 Tax=Erysipelothrix urinaevulpis TaxID=2683717 RepID=UPI00135A813A|nr:metalloregulator ArsR/SmtB family transcription factor [Erysipelothrix urinaevulpis]
MHLLDKDIQETMTEFFKALAHPNRLQILFLLRNKELSVTEICEVMELEQSYISHQLKNLKNTNLINRYRDGKQMKYFLSDNHVIDLLDLTKAHLKEENCNE